VRLSESNTAPETPRSLPFALGAGAPHVVRASRLAKAYERKMRLWEAAFGKHFVEKIVEQGRHGLDALDHFGGLVSAMSNIAA